MTKPPILGPGWLTVQELAAKLGVSHMNAYKALHAGNGLEVVSIGHRYYIREDTVMPMLKTVAQKRMAEVTCFTKG